MSDRITGLIVAVLALAFAASASQLEEPFFADPLGPKAFPLLLSSIAFLAGANSIFYGDKLLTTGNPQAERDRALFAKLGLHPERRDTCEDDTQRAERLAQQAQRNAQAERAAALAVDASV